MDPPDHSLSLGGIHTVAMQLNEEPVWPLPNINRSPLPELEPAQTWRISRGQGRILEASDAVARTFVKIQHQWALYHERKRLRRTTKAQVSSFAVWSSGIDRKAALIQRVHFPNLCRVECSSGKVKSA